jgi:glutaryl-CoA dehydrogenase
MATDFLQLSDFYSEEQQMIKSATSEYVKSSILPTIEQDFSKERFPKSRFKELGKLGFLGPFVEEKYGGINADFITYGIIMQELEKGDSGLRSAASVQGSLVMYPIWAYGTEEQKLKYLPKLASGDWVGCFGLTEPDFGSNPHGMQTRLTNKNGVLVLNGSKLWITNAPFADVAVVWAKNDEGRIVGVLVEKGMDGFTTPTIHNKWSLRASHTGELVFDNVIIPESHILPKRTGLSAPLKCLDSARFGISWGVIGAAISCYETAVRYAKERIQFGKPIGGFQLTQEKLANMLTAITQAQLLAFRVGQLKNEGKASSTQISMAKRNNVAMALKVARDSRQILGAMGITSEFPIMRHMMNLESVITYEGTNEIHTLILGKHITGISAFE